MKVTTSESFGKDEVDDVEGFVARLTPKEPDDMWHAFNLIQVGDVVRAMAQRRVVYETSTGSVKSERKMSKLTIRVDKPPVFDGKEELQVSGRIVVESDIASVGQHHTIDLELNREFTLWKRYGWDSVSLGALEEARNPDVTGSVAAVSLHEGLANICLITPYQTKGLAEVQHPIPKKMSKTEEQNKEKNNFFRKIVTLLTQHIDFSGGPRPLLLASPGFWAANLKDYMRREGERLGDKTLLRLGNTATIVHSSSGHVGTLNQVIKSPEVKATMGDMRFAKETATMDEFYDRLRKDDGRAWYGPDIVEKAVHEDAIGPGGGVLFVGNSLFRSEDVAERRRFVGLVDKVKAGGGDVRILSSEHESGKRLELLGNIACILSYPIYDLDEDGDEDEGGDDAGAAAQGGQTII